MRSTKSSLCAFSCTLGSKCGSSSAWYARPIALCAQGSPDLFASGCLEYRHVPGGCLLPQVLHRGDTAAFLFDKPSLSGSKVSVSLFGIFPNRSRARSCSESIARSCTESCETGASSASWTGSSKRAVRGDCDRPRWSCLPRSRLSRDLERPRVRSGLSGRFLERGSSDRSSSRSSKKLAIFGPRYFPATLNHLRCSCIKAPVEAIISPPSGVPFVMRECK